jgi:hypothetical protein
MATEHTSKSTGKGSKQTISTIYGPIDIEISVKGYKSSEGAEVFAPPNIEDVVAPHPERSEGLVEQKEEEVWEDEGGST